MQQQLICRLQMSFPFRIWEIMTLQNILYIVAVSQDCVFTITPPIFYHQFTKNRYFLPPPLAFHWYQDFFFILLPSNFNSLPSIPSKSAMFSSQHPHYLQAMPMKFSTSFSRTISLLVKVGISSVGKLTSIHWHIRGVIFSLFQQLFLRL